MSEGKVKGSQPKKQHEKEEIDEEEKMKKLRRKRILSQLSRAPGKCPLGNCEQVLFPSGLLAHLLHRHGQDPKTKVSIIYDNQPFRLTFKPDSFEMGVPQALAILLYAGTEGRPQTRPARRYLSFSNCGLLNDLRRYENHLTLVLMFCKTTWSSMLPDRELAAELEESNRPENTIYLMWLVAPVTASRMFYTITAFDRFYIQSRSVIRKARNYAVSQDPKDFLCGEWDYLMLRHEEAMDLMSNVADPNRDGLAPGIRLELFVQEDLSWCSPENGTSRDVLDNYIGPGTKMPRNKMNLYRDAQGKLSLNRKPLSIPTIGSPKVSYLEMDSYRQEEAMKNIKVLRNGSRKMTKARRKGEHMQAGQEISYSSDSRDISLDSSLINTIIRDQEKLLKKGLKTNQEVISKETKNYKKDHDKCNKNLQTKLSKYLIPSERRKAKARKLLKRINKYLETCPEESSSATECEESLEEFTEKKTTKRGLGGEGKVFDHQLTIKNPKQRKTESPEKSSRSCVKAGSSRGVTNEPLHESILNLQIPIAKDVLETMKEAVINSVKEAVRKVAEQTVITQIGLPPELILETEPLEEPEINPETKPGIEPETDDKAKADSETETETPLRNLAKIPAVSIGIEAVLGSDCDTYSETWSQ
ncbi:uncharacterized protein boil [Drosophila takahashii]|uniref:uncharacterized protein boil n=1 Tax=Drosophila takahashii TaxID=29030 RepID=UPI00389956CD